MKLIFEICITREQVAYYESGYRAGESVRRSPEYEWTDMCRSKGHRKPENVEITVHGSIGESQKGTHEWNIWAG